MESKSPFKDQYEKILEAKKKDPQVSLAAECKRQKISYQGLLLYKRRKHKVDLAEKRQGVMVRKQPVPAKGPVKPSDEYVYIPVKKSEVVDMVVHKRHQIVIPSDKVFHALDPEASRELDALIGKVLREEALKKPPEEVGLSMGGGKKGGLLNKGG